MSRRQSRRRNIENPGQGSLFEDLNPTPSSTPQPEKPTAEPIESGNKGSQREGALTSRFEIHPISKIYNRAEYVDPEILQERLRPTELASLLPIRIPAQYVEATIDPMVNKTRKADELHRTSHKDRERSTYRSESEQWHHMERLLETLGPYELISYVHEHTKDAYKKRTPLYQRRIFRRKSEATEFQGKLEKNGVRSVVPHALALLGLPDDTRDHNQAFERLADLSSAGILDTIAHPKEALMVDLISTAPQLEKGGRVVLLCNNEQQTEHLHKILSRHPRVSHITSFDEVLRSPEHAENLASPEHAYSSPSGKVEVVIASAHQLAQLKAKNYGAEIQAALFLAYDLGATMYTKAEDRHNRQQPEGIPRCYRYTNPTGDIPQKGSYPKLTVSKAIALDTAGSSRNLHATFPFERAKPSQSKLFS